MCLPMKTILGSTIQRLNYGNCSGLPDTHRNYILPKMANNICLHSLQYIYRTSTKAFPVRTYSDPALRPVCVSC